jgi:hypothetical protein
MIRNPQKELVHRLASPARALTEETMAGIVTAEVKYGVIHHFTQGRCTSDPEVAKITLMLWLQEPNVGNTTVLS